ncbi:hypothetical protein [Ramlibacter albus]|uniref:Uncharacterized protein n=1 Tax=Ramlibacter albus TaxID=2079448 RepID=A0A923S368_9BURK|nr:hypothetical protein [Ramlibacter albus]MBC5766234.1 hypothetical protein [Ramlibacter albus]
MQGVIAPASIAGANAAASQDATAKARSLLQEGLGHTGYDPQLVADTVDRFIGCVQGATLDLTPFGNPTGKMDDAAAIVDALMDCDAFDEAMGILAQANGHPVTTLHLPLRDFGIPAIPMFWPRQGSMPALTRIRVPGWLEQPSRRARGEAVLHLAFPDMLDPVPGVNVEVVTRGADHPLGIQRPPGMNVISTRLDRPARFRALVFEWHEGKPVHQPLRDPFSVLLHDAGFEQAFAMLMDPEFGPDDAAAKELLTACMAAAGGAPPSAQAMGVAIKILVNRLVPLPENAGTLVQALIRLGRHDLELMFSALHLLRLMEPAAAHAHAMELCDECLDVTNANVAGNLRIVRAVIDSGVLAGEQRGYAKKLLGTLRFMDEWDEAASLVMAHFDCDVDRGAALLVTRLSRGDLAAAVPQVLDLIDKELFGPNRTQGIAALQARLQRTPQAQAAWKLLKETYACRLVEHECAKLPTPITVTRNGTDVVLTGSLDAEVARQTAYLCTAYLEGSGLRLENRLAPA